MSRHFTNTELSDTLDLSEDSTGFWLYDKTRGRRICGENDNFKKPLTGLVLHATIYVYKE